MMKKKIILLTTSMILTVGALFAHTTMKEYKAGHQYYVSLPDYMTKTTGLNDAASMQFQNTVKDIAGFIIYDTNEELDLVDMKFSSLKEYYDYFVKDFLKDQKNRKISDPVTGTIGGNNYIEFDASYYSKESKCEIYYYVGLLQTPSAFYKLLCFGGMDGKELYKADYQKILMSIKD